VHDPVEPTKTAIQEVSVTLNLEPGVGLAHVSRVVIHQELLSVDRQMLTQVRMDFITPIIGLIPIGRDPPLTKSQNAVAASP
jgi:hypothetical protein